MHKRLMLFLILACTMHATLADTCKKLLHELANEQSLFIYCSTVHAVPMPPQNASFCTSCKVENDAMTLRYNDVISNCSKQYTDEDRMNILITAQSLLKELWNKAYCDSKYDLSSPCRPM